MSDGVPGNLYKIPEYLLPAKNDKELRPHSVKEYPLYVRGKGDLLVTITDHEKEVYDRKRIVLHLLKYPVDLSDPSIEQLKSGVQAFLTLHQIFKERFLLAPVEKPIDPCIIVLSDEQYSQFRGIIRHSKLDNFESLLLLIARIFMEVYSKEVSKLGWWKRKGLLTTPKRLAKQFENLRQVLLLGTLGRKEDIKEIIFIGSKSGAIKFNDRFLISRIRRYLKEGFKVDDKNLDESIDFLKRLELHDFDLLNFHLLASYILHEFLKQARAFNFGSKETLQDEVYFIARFLSFCHIPFFEKESGRKYEINDRLDMDSILQQIKKGIKIGIKKYRFMQNQNG